MSNVRSGRIITKKIDDVEQNEEKKKFETFIRFYKNELSNVAISIKTLEILTKETEDINMFNKYCPSFFTATLYNFWAQSVIGLNECFNGDDYGYKKFFNFVESNWNKIFTAQWEKIINWSDETNEESKKIKWDYQKIHGRISQAQQILDSNSATVAKIKSFRDKVYAHIDKKQPNENINLIELRQIFNVAENIFNVIFSLYDLSECKLEPLNSGDVNTLIYVVSQYDKYHDEIKELRKNDRRKQLVEVNEEHTE